MGGSNEHPAAVDIKYRLRWFILGKHSAAVFSEKQNTKEKMDTCLLQPLHSTKIANEESCLTTAMLSSMAEKSNLSAESDDEENNSKYIFTETCEQEIYEFDNSTEALFSLDNFIVKERVNDDMLVFIAEYVAYRFQNKYNLGIPTKKLDITKAPELLEYVSRGNLLYPNEDLLEATKVLDVEFHKIHGNCM